MRRFVTIPVTETHRCVVWYPFPLISYFQIIGSNPCISCKKNKIQTLFIITSALFCGAEQIKDWMFPCIMCTQNPNKRNELKQFMELNNNTPMRFSYWNRHEPSHSNEHCSHVEICWLQMEWPFMFSSTWIHLWSKSIMYLLVVIHMYNKYLFV
jgi:hypothetical protein